VIIVGTKSDLRENPEQDDGESQVTPEEGTYTVFGSNHVSRDIT